MARPDDAPPSGPRELAFAHSPDADDLYMVAPLDLGWMEADLAQEGLRLKFEADDVDSLNRAAGEGRHDLTALSFAAYPAVRDHYRLSTAGSSVREGAGPILAGASGARLEDLGEGPVAVPGLQTSSCLALRRWRPDLRVQVVAFREIPARVAEGRFAAGLLIDESQFDIVRQGLVPLLDLGAWWKSEYDLPLPMGGVALRRTLPEEVQKAVQRILRRSVRMALDNHAACLAHVAARCPEVDPTLLERHVRAWVNDFSVDLGARGRQSVTFLLGEDPDWIEA